MVQPQGEIAVQRMIQDMPHSEVTESTINTCDRSRECRLVNSISASSPSGVGMLHVRLSIRHLANSIRLKTFDQIIELDYKT